MRERARAARRRGVVADARRTVGAAVAVGLAPALAGAQVAEAPPPAAGTSPWTSAVELAGSLFIGNKPQSLLTTRVRTSHADSTYELGADVRFVYGEATVDDSTVVSQRGWLGTLTLDLWPFASQSPFVLGTVESSLVRRVELRVSAGVGHKVTFVETDRALANVSLAVLGERSRLPQANRPVLTETLTRLSLRTRLRRKLGTRAEVSHETSFRPELAALRRYTFVNSSSATYAMTERLDLKLTYLDSYDSEARLRGAESNYDGQLVLGAAADF